MRWLLVVGLCCVVVVVACKRTPNLEERFAAAADEVDRLEHAFEVGHTRALEELRRVRSDPAATAALIETTILPLFRPLVDALARAHQLGMELADRVDDPGKRAELRLSFGRLATAREAFDQIRDAYAEHAKKLAKGSASDADVEALVKTLEDAGRLVRK